MSAPRNVDDRLAYARAMMSGNHAVASQIEQMHDLYGYPPELVSVGLSAVAEGKDAHQAISDYIDFHDGTPA